MHEIRETTVKGLEPELMRVIEKSREEQRKIHDLHLQETRQLREQMQDEYEMKVRQIQEKCLVERDLALERERQRGIQKLEDQY